MTWPVASIFADVWDHLVDNDRQYVFIVLLGFLGSFGFIRLSTRLMRSPKVPWWPGSVVSGSGLHVHHLVFGIVTMMVAGVLSFAVPDVGGPWYGIYAGLFGIGLGLTVDEYALWLRLSDVYWSEEGRSSIDFALLLAAFMGLLLVSAVPNEIHTSDVDTLAYSLVALAFHLFELLVCVSKKRFAHALTGIFIPGPALYGAVRLGKPDSPWARRFYAKRNPRKQARSEQRFRPDRRTARFKEWVISAIGGVTEDEYKARLAAADPAREKR